MSIVAVLNLWLAPTSPGRQVLSQIQEGRARKAKNGEKIITRQVSKLPPGGNTPRQTTPPMGILHEIVFLIHHPQTTCMIPSRLRKTITGTNYKALLHRMDLLWVNGWLGFRRRRWMMHGEKLLTRSMLVTLGVAPRSTLPCPTSALTFLHVSSPKPPNCSTFVYLLGPAPGCAQCNGSRLCFNTHLRLLQRLQ